MLKGYTYTGPLPLGSVVAHNCGAAGLFSDNVNPDVVLQGIEQKDTYVLTVQIGSVNHELSGPITSLGRRQIGQALLVLLREQQGLPAYNEWGTMVGVRPTKLFHKYMDQYGSVDCATRHIRDEFSVSMEKLDLLGRIGMFQRPYVTNKTDREVSLYCGIPFCETRCVYCSFPYGLYQNYANQQAFLQALGHDISHMGRICESNHLHVDTMYMGGGTPTILGNEDFDYVLSMLSTVIEAGREFTVEAGRPDSVTIEKLQSMERHHVNRISINPQTLDDSILRAIGRGHTVQDIHDLYTYVKEHTGFSVNMDFIAGLPGQHEEHMIHNMEYICHNLPENVTIHTLAIKRGSPLYDSAMQEQLPDESEVRHMVHYAQERLEAAGYVPYYLYRQQYMTGSLENIGYTLPGKECVYNINMMEERQTIMSMGPGSSSKWMRAPQFRQIKQHMPKDVDVYNETIHTLLDKRHALSKTFWEDHNGY